MKFKFVCTLVLLMGISLIASSGECAHTPITACEKECNNANARPVTVDERPLAESDLPEYSPAGLLLLQI